VAYVANSGIVVDDSLRTTNRRIFAAGDVCLEHQFTDTAEASAGIVIRNALCSGRERLRALSRSVRQCGRSADRDHRLRSRLAWLRRT